MADYLAPALSSSSRIPLWPFSVASINAVMPSLPLDLTSAPLSISACTNFTGRPFREAYINIVVPSFLLTLMSAPLSTNIYNIAQRPCLEANINTVVSPFPLALRSTPEAMKRLTSDRSPRSAALSKISFTSASAGFPLRPRITSFCPETAIFRNFCVNLQVCWCGEQMFASAQPFDFFDLAENISFPYQKLN
jgi:hypothetical protein